MVCQMMERLPFCFCWRSHTASAHVKWKFLPEGKVIEMSEKEPESLEEQGH